MKKHLLICATALSALIVTTAQTPDPFGALPSERQLAWHELDYYAFVHFNINTFSDLEWGHGTESPQIFNPTQLDCRQWAKVCKEAGMKGIILTAKHHDGFCLWPSQYTEHSVKNSPWRGGKGDLLQELSEACREYGLKMGVYISPWDRNNPLYGTPAYNDYFVSQLKELLTGYGELFEVWFDGAVSEEYKGQQLYDWDAYIKTVRQYQPNAVIFSDAGPDVRWVGTERGFANPTNWCTLNKDDYYPGTPRYLELRSGNKNGTHWLPAEVDVSIRPGWYYHADEDEQVKSAEHLELIYYNSVGRNANLLLNLPVDRRGLVHENDITALKALRERLDNTFGQNLAKGAHINASSEFSNALKAGNLIDDNPDNYWAAEMEAQKAALEINLENPITFNVLELREYLPLGQRIEQVLVEAWVDNTWRSIGWGTTVGSRLLVRLPETQCQRLKVTLTGMASPALKSLALYQRPHDNYLLESEVEFEERMAWWRDAGFGLFIHWGAYAVPGGIHQGKEVSGAGEWIMFSGQIPVPDYEPYTQQFNPLDFNAAEWVSIAKDAGMKYLVITSKHHDGFCLWDSQISDYDVMDASPFKRDILKELRDACEDAGIRFCFYHSIMDWHHPDAQGKDFGNPNPAGPDFAAYRENYLKPQLKELVERYNPHVMWFDGEWINEWTEEQGKDLYQYVRSLKPDIIINNRVGKGRQGMQGMNKEGDDVGDFGTPEQEILDYGTAELDWESCMTMNDSWGFKRNDHNWKSTKDLIHNLIDIAAKGGNYLLNVGPTPEGLIPAASVERLAGMGEWMRVNAPVVHNSQMWPQYKEGENIRYTTDAAGFVYASCLEWPGKTLQIKYVRPKANSIIQMLGVAQPLAWQYDPVDGLSIEIPAFLQAEQNRPCQYAWVFKMQADYPDVAMVPQFAIEGKKVEVQGIFSDKTTVTLSSDTPDSALFYTTDGSTPTQQSTRYQQPIAINQTTMLKAIAFHKNMVSSPIALLHLQQSRFHKIELQYPFAEKYNGGGMLGLIDGRKGSKRFSDGLWQGFSGKDLVATIDLGKVQEFQRVEATFLRDIGAWIFAPLWVEVAISEDGEHFTSIGRQNGPTAQADDGNDILAFSFEKPSQARFIRLTAQNIGICPDWHGGAGGDAWLFVDEIEVK
ncbi:MAG TPA: alpha-L-fucosidase [Saprospiraceae bacterium]|nr:alpha-L-fucosidase [Saprospiraceae bacterium]HMQ83320.1 alpha-L-fucosidase [Saprospiraceae bacterium]